MAIQIGTLRTWTQKDGTESKPFFKAVKGFHYNTLKDLFDGIEQDLDKYIGKNEQFNLFYTVGHHLEGQRTKSSWQCQNIVPFDLDGIDLDQIDKYPPLVAEACGFDLDKCSIVYSGNGIHILVQVPTFGKDDKEYIKTQKKAYKQLVKQVKAACDSAKLPYTDEKNGPCDSTVWDYARILRVPFTVNKKVKKQEDGSTLEVIKECRIVQNNLEEQEWSLPDVKAEEAKSLKVGTFPMPDHDEVLRECEFFKWLKDKPDEVHEPHAYAMLSITGHFNDEGALGTSLYSKFSSPSISAKPYQEFSEQALTTSGPRTCKGIDDVWGSCSSCPHYNKINSPILLKGPDHIGTAHIGFSTPTGKGGVRRHYDDLAKFMVKEKDIAVLPNKKGEMFTFNGKYFEGYADTEAKMDVQDLFRPTVEDDKIRTQAVNQIKATRKALKPKDFFLTGTEGLLNLDNGTFNFETGELEEHSTKYGFLNVVDYKYDPEATCPTWNKFLSAAMKGDEELIRIVEEIMSFTISGMSYEKLQFYFLFIGTGFNGKSVLLGLLGEMLGNKGVCAHPLEDLIKDEKCRADLAYNLANIVPDSSALALKGKDLTRLKSWTGNDTVTGREIYKEGITFVNKAKFIFGFNDKPEIKAKSKGDSRRIKTVPFKADFNGDEKHLFITDLAKKLKEERSGILNNLIKAYKRLNEKGFSESKKIAQEQEEMKKHADPVYDFYTDFIEYEDGGKVSCEALLNMFNSNNEYSTDGFDKTQRTFTKEIGNFAAMGIVDKRIILKKIRVNGKVQRGLLNAKINIDDSQGPKF